MSNQSSFKLNPSATEFVPSFALTQPTTTTSYNTTNSNSNSNNYYNNQGRQNNYHNQRNNNNNNNYYNNNNNYNNNRNNQYNNNNHYQTYSNSDVDPFEMEARCEAVVEILQDDRVREHLNPTVNETSPPQAVQANFEESPEQCDDEEEMLEMMQMQEECRLEMMKFYIQSQNPKLFEEIYHDVSYPDGYKPPQTTANNNENTEKHQTSDKTSSLKESIKDGLNNNSTEFMPKQLAELSLKDKEQKN